MDIIEKKFKSTSSSDKWVISIGNFDGFHLGHAALTEQVLEDAQKTGSNSGILTFEPHPKQILQSHIPFRYIYDNEKKWSFLKKVGLDSCFVIPFTIDFANLNALRFLERLFNSIPLKKIVVGYDFNFGKDREGSVRALREETAGRNIDFLQMEAVKIGGLTVSSTMIRRLLFEGDFKNVEKFLGRSWAITGTVQKGKNMGKTLGFPTMNIKPKVSLPIKKGVFACRLKMDDKMFDAVCNVGMNPTFNRKTLVVEAHILDYGGSDAYGSYVEIFPEKYLREEIKFASVNDLKRQIQKDTEKSRQLFNRLNDRSGREK